MQDFMHTQNNRSKAQNRSAPRTAGNHRQYRHALISRRRVLKSLAVMSAGLIAGASKQPHAARANENNLALDITDPRLLPYPGKREIIDAMGDSISIEAATLPQIPPNVNRILEVSEWNVGHFPNYSDSAYVDNRPYVWVAAFGNRTVTSLNVEKNMATALQTGEGTLPLDVAYDHSRNRVVVASADDGATMIVLDTLGNTLIRKRLSNLTGQGLSVGGAQGVAVDGDGNYWLALAYHGLGSHGVVVKIDGTSHKLLLLIKDVYLHNPNGLLYVDDGRYILALSDNGVAHQFSLDGTLQRVLKTVHIGYRGTVSRGKLWVASWSSTGEMVEIDLKTEERKVHFCVPLANSICIDHNDHIWVAGDAGLSVSTSDGSLLTMTSNPSFSNGLTTIGGKTFHVTSEVSPNTDSNTLKQVALVSKRVHLPGLFSAGR